MILESLHGSHGVLLESCGNSRREEGCGPTSSRLSFTLARTRIKFVEVSALSPGNGKPASSADGCLLSREYFSENLNGTRVLEVRNTYSHPN